MIKLLMIKENLLGGRKFPPCLPPGETGSANREDGLVALHASPWEQVSPLGGPGTARLGDTAGLRPGGADWQSLHGAVPGAMGHLC